MIQLSKVIGILKVLLKPTGRGRDDISAQVFPSSGVRLIRKNSKAQEPQIDNRDLGAFNSASGRQKKRPIRHHARLAKTPPLTRLEDQDIPLAKISVEVLGLSERASKRLRTANISTIQQLANCADSDLLSINGLGITTVEEIKKKLNSYLFGPSSASDRKSDITGINKRLVEAPLLESFEHQGRPPDKISVQILGLTEQESNELKMFKISTIQELVNCAKSGFLSIPNLEMTTVEEIKKKLNSYLAGLLSNKVPAYECIDDEVNELVGYLDDRERFILTNRFGIGKHLTLEMIGEQFLITRERVRQIESKMRNKLVNRLAKSPLLYSTAGIALLKRLDEDTTVDSWRQQLMDIGFLKEEASADLLVAISRVTNNSRLALPEEFDQMLETHVSPHILLARKPVLNKARRFCRNCGAIRIVSLTSEKLSEADVEQILCSDGFTEVSPGWWMRKIGECVPERVARKVITYCGPVSPSNLRQALIRYLSRFQFPAPPSEVLVKTLEQTGKFALVDEFLQLTKMAARKRSLTRPESIFVRTVHNEGPIISFESLHAKILGEGFSEASLTSALHYSPIVQKVALGLYTLLGTQYDIGDVERTKSQLTRVSANSSIKPRSDGVIEFETNIGTWMIYGGVLSCGPAASMEGTWTRIVDGVNNGELVVGGGFIRGLSEAVESLDLMPGDRIKIEFNTWTREATITKLVNNEQIC